MRTMSLMLAGCLVGCAADTTGTDDTDTDAAAAGDTDGTAAQLPDPAPVAAYSGLPGASCPDMEGDVRQMSSHTFTNRALTVVLPDKTKNAGVLFAWHGNGDTGKNFASYLNASSLADDLGVIVVAPESDAGGFGLDWGVPPNNTKGDSTFFDDILACLDAQYELDRSRVYSVGFSAGALWTSWLAMNRSDYLAATVMFSGGSDGDSGVPGVKVNPYSMPDKLIPVLMTEGGPQDEVVVNFQDMTNNMSRKLRRDGHTAIVCSHSQGHTPPNGFQNWAWDFLDAHRYGMDPSPYASSDPSGNLPANCTWE